MKRPSSRLGEGAEQEDGHSIQAESLSSPRISLESSTWLLQLKGILQNISFYRPNQRGKGNWGYGGVVVHRLQVKQNAVIWSCLHIRREDHVSEKNL
jgi:hypothetical protein